MSTAGGDAAARISAPLAELKYSLPELLREVEIERRAPVFAMEKLDQSEIKKLFPRNNRRRATTKRK